MLSHKVCRPLGQRRHAQSELGRRGAIYRIDLKVCLVSLKALKSLGSRIQMSVVLTFVVAKHFTFFGQTKRPELSA